MPPPSPLGWEFLLVLAAILAVLGASLLVLTLRRHGRDDRARKTRAVVVAVLLLLIAASSGGLAYSAYVEGRTWTFFYYAELRPNGSAPEVVILPIPQNESLLSGVHISSGQANWSLVDTPYGRGLYVAFTGSASIEAAVPGRTDSTLASEYSPTLATGPVNNSVEVWTYYSGGAGVQVHLQVHWWQVTEFPDPGWSTRMMYFAPPP